MVLTELPRDLILALHLATARALMGIAVDWFAVGLTTHVFPDEDGPAVQLVLVGTGAGGVSRAWRQLAVATEDEAAKLAMLRLRVEVALEAARAADRRAAVALGKVPPPRPLPRRTLS